MKMKISVSASKQSEFIAGLVMLIAGVFVFAKNIYVATPFNAGGISIGGFYLRTGIFILPLTASMIWLFLSQKKKLPSVACILSLILIVAVAIGSVAIRVSYISLPKWLIILFLIFGGTVLILRAVHLSRVKK